jgi:uncharacterized protein YlxW (UPF0749 family)
VAQAAQPAVRPPHRSLRDRLGVVAVLVAAGLLFAASASAAGGGNLRSDAEDLPALIRQETRQVESTSERVTELRDQIDELTGAVGDSGVKALQKRADAMRPEAGLAAVEGPGITVTLEDAPHDRPVPEDLDKDLLVVHQQDVEAVVNALWAGGAEAMMLMDQRVISTSAVRCVGSTLRLQGRVYSPPYTITAIGDPDSLAAALSRSPEVQIYQQYVAAYGLGYQQEKEQSITMPAYGGSLDMRYASVPDKVDS